MNMPVTFSLRLLKFALSKRSSLAISKRGASPFLSLSSSKPVNILTPDYFLILYLGTFISSLIFWKFLLLRGCIFDILFIYEIYEGRATASY